MSRRRYLSQKQQAVLDDLFSEDYDEDEVRRRHRLMRGTLNRWLGDALFIEEFERRVRSSRFLGAALLAKSSYEAAAKLVKLKKEKLSPETARKICLDIIRLGKEVLKSGLESIEQEKNREAGSESSCQISAEKAEKLLKVLAE